MRHIGAEAFIQERQKLLRDYDSEKAQNTDDCVRTSHGNVGEAALRTWLRQFLPKKFGVTKGYIITHDLSYEGPLEEWDIIIYDRLESPVLFARRSAGEEGALAIPIEHVRGVVEAKATFTPTMATRLCTKLQKLQAFAGTNTNNNYPTFLCNPFVSTGIFFETSVKNYYEYRSALNALIPLGEQCPGLLGFLILRSQRMADHCAYLQFLAGEKHVGLDNYFEMSTEFRRMDGRFGLLGSIGGWGVNYFSTFMFDFLAALAGKFRPGRTSSWYGLDFGKAPCSWLFETMPGPIAEDSPRSRDGESNQENTEGGEQR